MIVFLASSKIRMKENGCIWLTRLTLVICMPTRDHTRIFYCVLPDPGWPSYLPASLLRNISPRIWMRTL
jgi:hypothetical protein